MTKLRKAGYWIGMALVGLLMLGGVAEYIGLFLR